jgi:uncharacterized integral membrane protein
VLAARNIHENDPVLIRGLASRGRTGDSTRPRLRWTSGGNQRAVTTHSEPRTVESSSSNRSHDAGVIVRFVLIAAIIVAIVLVALDNTDDVRIGYVFGHKNAPVWIVLVAAAVAGVIIGWLLKHRPRRHND